MVTLWEFNTLSIPLRYQYMMEKGSHVASGADTVSAFVFYQVDDFFVEIVYDQEFNAIVSVVPFTKDPRHERMVKTMEVPEG